MSVFTNSINIAKRQIKKYGQKVAWTVASDDQSADPNVQQVYVVFKSPSSTEAFLRFIAGSDATIGNVDAIMAQQSFIPTGFDSVTRIVGGVEKTYSIKSLTPVQPGEEVIVWKIEFNK